MRLDVCIDELRPLDKKNPTSRRVFSCPRLKTPESGIEAEWVAYFAFTIASVISSMRFEKPHSLSYQLSTLTSVPSITRVCVES